MNTRVRISTCLAAFAMCCRQGSAVPVNPTPSESSRTVTVAKTLAENDFNGWTFGSNEGKKQINCVLFIDAVVSKGANAPITRAQHDAIKLAYNWTEQDEQKFAKEGTDKRLDGVVYALTELGKQGERVLPKDAKAGDIIQYWGQKTDGTYFGHAAVISERKDNTVRLYGPNEKAGEIANDLVIPLDESRYRIAIVRLQEPKK